MFVAMHREFQGSVREELARVEKLTRELDRLNARLGELPGLAASGPEDPPAGARPEAGDVRSERPTKRRPDTAAPVERGPAHGAAEPRRPTRPKPEPEHAGPAPADRRPPSARPTARIDSTDMYADLTRRISQLQRERRGYWQRILKAING
jgi:hypothetical protein